MPRDPAFAKNSSWNHSNNPFLSSRKKMKNFDPPFVLTSVIKKQTSS
jgi:hypothetical protein